MIGCGAVAAIALLASAVANVRGRDGWAFALGAATIVGLAQTVYALMPGAWRKLEEASSRATGQDEPQAVQDGTNTAQGHRGPPAPLRSAQSGLESSEGGEPYRQRTLNHPEEVDEDGYPRG